MSLDTLPVGFYRLYLKVPDDNDLPLGTISVYER